MTIDRIEWARLRRRLLTPAGNGVRLSVTAAATTKAVAFTREMPDTTYGIVATPSWNTTVYPTNRTTTGFTLNFGTAAPANATVDYVTFRSE